MPRGRRKEGADAKGVSNLSSTVPEQPIREDQSRNGVTVTVFRFKNGSTVVDASCQCFGAPFRLHSSDRCPARGGRRRDGEALPQLRIGQARALLLVVRATPQAQAPRRRALLGEVRSSRSSRCSAVSFMILFQRLRDLVGVGCSTELCSPSCARRFSLCASARSTRGRASRSSTGSVATGHSGSPTARSSACEKQGSSRPRINAGVRRHGRSRFRDQRRRQVPTREGRVLHARG